MSENGLQLINKYCTFFMGGGGGAELLSQERAITGNETLKFNMKILSSLVLRVIYLLINDEKE